MLIVHRSERTDVLADVLAEVLSTPLTVDGGGRADPFAPEIVCVPARGVERWLQQHLACRLGTGTPGGRDGISANIDFPSPAELADRIVASVHSGAPFAGAGAGRADNPWHGPRLVWPVLRVLDAGVEHALPEFEATSRHVGSLPALIAGGMTEQDARDEADYRRGRRYATARQIADLFAQYAAARPSMLAAWAAGPGPDGRDLDGASAPVADGLGWQPGFFRAVRAEVGAPHPAEYLDAVCARLREDPAVGGLPDRLSVFGPTRITESFRLLLAAAAEHHDVHLYLPHPSPTLWAAGPSPVRAEGAARTPAPPVSRQHWRRRIPAHPLLASLARDAGELQERLTGLADEDLHHDASPGVPGTVLASLQAGLREDRLRPGAFGHDVPDGSVPDSSVPDGSVPDGSVEVHACHGPQRQVEVLRDRLLHLFSADPTLQPRDVLIMCPDVETFSPLIRGAFGQTGLDHPAFSLRVRLADRGVRQLNPVLEVIAHVVGLAAGRLTAGEVLDLAAAEPVRIRFGFSDSDLDSIREWVGCSGVRWGLGERDRRRFGMGAFGQGTFTAGLDRIALGAVADEADGQWLGVALPLDAVESTSIDLFGRFTEFVNRLEHVLVQMDTPASPARWAAILSDGLRSLTAAVPGEEWTTAAALRTIGRVLDDDRPERVASSASVTGTVLRLADVRDLMAGLLVSRAGRSNFRTGELTVCSMVPMRSVPHRVIILLGIDADTFPRVTRVDGDDVCGVRPLVGERNPRDEDRQAFLDAICAATETLHVYFTGADPITGRPVPPAVVVTELIDAVDTLTGATPTGSATPSVLRSHTLHAFDVRNFIDGAVAGVGGPFSHDTALLDGARALWSGPREPAARVPARCVFPVPDDDTDVGEGPRDIDLAELIAFHTSPIEAFFRQRLQIWIPQEEQAHADELDIDLGGLDEWGVGDRLLGRMLAGVSMLDCQAAELRRGTLPPRMFGSRQLRRIANAVTEVHAAVTPLRGQALGAAADPRTADVLVPLADGRRIHGTIADVYGESVVSATFSKLRSKQRLALWIGLLALAATIPSGSGAAVPVTSAVTVGRSTRRSGGVSLCRFRVPENPVAILEELVAVRDLGMRKILPVTADLAAEFVESEHWSGGRVALTSARRSFHHAYGEANNRFVRMAFGGDVSADVTFDDLLVDSIGASGPVDWRALGLEPDLELGDYAESVFCALARRLWNPLLAHEVTA